MSNIPTADDIRDFNGFLRNATRTQLRGILEKERAARRSVYVALTESEIVRRADIEVRQ